MLARMEAAPERCTSEHTQGLPARRAVVCASWPSGFGSFKKAWSRGLESTEPLAAVPEAEGSWEIRKEGHQRIYHLEDRFLRIRFEHGHVSIAYPIGRTEPSNVENVTRPELVTTGDSSTQGFQYYAHGDALLDGWIDTEGVPQYLMVLRCRPCGSEMERRIVERFKGYRYTPAIEDGRPVEFYMTFRLSWGSRP